MSAITVEEDGMGLRRAGDVRVEGVREGGQWWGEGVGRR